MIRQLRLHRPLRFLHMPWPLPALLAWATGWAASRVAVEMGAAPALAWAAGCACGLLLACACHGAWRRGIAALGFPLSTLALGAWPSLPAWSWLLLAAPLAALYPLGTWRDAPFFPTPRGALQGLDQVPGLAAPRAVLDIGCGLGHGLAALKTLWPRASLVGLERSRVLRTLAAWRCPWAQVMQGDMWAANWAGHDLVYVFQRPESMARVLAKAQQDLAPGSWLVSLEFAVPGATATAELQAAGRRPLWLYRMPDRAEKQPLRNA